jgi:ADP-ribose pyrophosphatase
MADEIKKNRAGWEILSTELLADYPIFSLFRTRRRNPYTGKEIEFIRMEGLDWCFVVPFDIDGNIILVRQYRHGIEDFTLELPGGCVEDGEDPKDSAMRELLEETGYVAASVVKLGCVNPNPALQANRCYLYRANGVEPARAQKLLPEERIEIVHVAPDLIPGMIKSGEISHALVVAAFGLLGLS